MSSEIPSYLREALSQFQGMEDIALQMLCEFQEATPSMLEKIRASIASKNATELEHAAHKLKGSLSYFRNEIFTASAQKLETLGAKNSFENAEIIFSQLEKQLQELLLAINNFLSTKRTVQ